MESTTFSTNITGKVRNTKLSKMKALWPLFEAISNSIHAIEERGNLQDGYVKIYVIRNGNPETLRQVTNAETYPVRSFRVLDNGIGFNERNYKSFLTAESDHKVDKGAKGIGRFVCLKAFRNVLVNSTFNGSGSKYYTRKFTLKSEGDGIFDYSFIEHSNESSEDLHQETSITLNQYLEEYSANCPRPIKELAEKIVEHFLIYFISEKCPFIELIDSDDKILSVQELYNSTVKPYVGEYDFEIKASKFKMYLVKLYETKGGQRIHYCANERSVKNEKLSIYLPDIGESSIDDAGDFTYQAYIIGNYLDENIDNERTGFVFPTGDGQLTEEEEMVISLKNIREQVISKIEGALQAYLTAVREAKFDQYRQHVYNESPQYRPVLKYMSEEMKRMPPGLSGNRLNIELYKLEMELDLKTKQLGEKVLNGVTDTSEYMSLYEEYIEKFNDIGKANLAKYVVHRKSIIELLDKFIGEDENGDLQTEEAVHKIFFPLRSVSDEISYERQNLWLIDERLAYHNYLASDKPLKTVEVFDGLDSSDRPDILVFNHSFAFVDDDAPHNSFVIVEFKRPERNNYSTDDEKKNPVDQVINYIRTIRESKATDRRGKTINIDKERTPFYAYIVCDFNSNLSRILEDKNYKKTPDGKGYFYYHEGYNAYIEVLCYEKLLKDAKIRNKILFDKLGLPH